MSQLPPAMSQPPDLPPEVPPGAPPMATAFATPVKRSAWPTVIGVISIVLGSMGVICTPIGLLLKPVLPSNPQLTENMPPWWGEYEVASTIAGVCMAILLLAAGAQLVRRRRSGVTLHRVYSVLAILINMAALVAILSMDLSKMDQATRLTMQISMFFGWVIGMVYPVFVLMWFLRHKVTEEADTWKNRLD